MSKPKPQPFNLATASLEAGVTLIEASAGTGKTYNIAGLFTRLILERGLEVGQILAVTYTEAATKELRDRIRSRLADALKVLQTGVVKDERDLLLKTIRDAANDQKLDRETGMLRLRLALAEFDNAPVYTIHGFCQRLLADRAFECGRAFETDILADELGLATDIARDFWRVHVTPRQLTASILLGQDLSLWRKGPGRRRVGPEALATLTGPLLNHPHLEILGPTTDQSFDSLEANLMDAIKALEEMESERVDAELFLKEAGKLKRGDYKAELVDGYLQGLEAIQRLEFTPGQWNDLKWFLPGTVLDERNHKNNFEPPNALAMAFLDACEAIHQAGEALANGCRTVFLEFAQTELPRRKQEAGLLGYGDMLTALDEALTNNPEGDLARAVRGQFQAAMIDEFQDTDPVQLNIFKTLFHHDDTTLFLIGDPKQSIYTFRGADIFSYLAARELAREERTLLVNYRSEPASIDAVGHLFNNRDGKLPGPFFYDAIQFEASHAPEDYDKHGAKFTGAETAPLHFWLWPGTDARNPQPPRAGDDWVAAGKARAELPGVVATAIVNLLHSRATFNRPGEKPESVQPASIAVLVAKNAQAVAMKKALAARGVPAVLKTHESVFASTEAADLGLLLEALAAPNDLNRVKQLLASDLLGFDGHALDLLTELMDQDDTESLKPDDERMVRVAKSLMDYRGLMVRDGFLPMFRRFLAEGQVREQALSWNNGDRRLTNLFHLIETLHETMATHRLSATALARWLARQRQDDRPDDKNLLRLESDENAVRLVTVHRSKGLEYPLVFLPFAWDRKNTPEEGFIFHPDPLKKPGFVALDLGSNDVAANRLLAAKENLANELRLLYVATTRAKHQCTVVHGRLGSPSHPQGQKEITGLSWLLHPQAGMEVDPANPDAGIAHLTPEIIQADIQPLVEKSGSTISAELLPDSKPARWENSSASSETLKALKFEGDTSAQEGIHAFSYWASGAHDFHDRHEQPDRDADADEPVEVSEPKGIHKFPAGNVAGLCLHGIMENLDFPQAKAGEAAQMEIVDRHLERCGYADHAAVFKANLTDMLRTPLRAEGDFKLADLQQKDRLVELDFTHRLKKVGPGELREIFERHQSDAWPETLPDRLSRLNFTPLRGYMRGAIDLVFRHGKRFHILDWKSNKLGNDASAYTADRLPAAMAHRLYHLQYHIYTVALDAYLRQRMNGYDYGRDFGGVFYVFNRGIDPAKPGQGVFYDLPNPELIADLSEAFGLR